MVYFVLGAYYLGRGMGESHQASYLLEHLTSRLYTITLFYILQITKGLGVIKWQYMATSEYQQQTKTKTAS
jgi:uncharacterized membrane protein